MPEIINLDEYSKILNACLEANQELATIVYEEILKGYRAIPTARRSPIERPAAKPREEVFQTFEAKRVARREKRRASYELAFPVASGALRRSVVDPSDGAHVYQTATSSRGFFVEVGSTLPQAFFQLERIPKLDPELISKAVRDRWVGKITLYSRQSRRTRERAQRFDIPMLRRER